MIKLDIEVDDNAVSEAVYRAINRGYPEGDQLPSWVAGIKYKLERGEWPMSVSNPSRDKVLTEYLILVSTPMFETCPMCDQPSVGPCLTHRS